MTFPLSSHIGPPLFPLLTSASVTICSPIVSASRRHPTVPSPAAFFDARRRLVEGQTQRATEVFSSLAVTYPNDPAVAYHLAVAPRYVADRPDEATAAAVRVGTLERRHGLPGYGWLMERIQGPHRVWLEGIRRPIVQR